jgi:hypothetical protein
MKRLLCLISLIAPSTAFAVIPVPGETERSYDFALSLGKTKTEFTYADTGIVDTTVEYIELSWYERVYAGIDIGLHVGRTFLSQTGRVTTLGAEPDGFQAGIGLRAVFFQTSPIQPFVHALYMYRRVKRDDSEPVTLSWHEPQMRLGVSTAPWGPLRVYGGANWSAVDGREQSRGTVTSTTDFERDSGVSGFIGFDFTVEPTGFIGVEAHAGDAGRGIEIYFKRQY